MWGASRHIEPEALARIAGQSVNAGETRDAHAVLELREEGRRCDRGFEAEGACVPKNRIKNRTRPQPSLLGGAMRMKTLLIAASMTLMALLASCAAVLSAKAFTTI